MKLYEDVLHGADEKVTFRWMDLEVDAVELGGVDVGSTRSRGGAAFELVNNSSSQLSMPTVNTQHSLPLARLNP